MCMCVCIHIYVCCDSSVIEYMESLGWTPFFPHADSYLQLLCAHMEIFRARAVRYNERVNTMVIKQNKSVQSDGKSFTNQ